MVNSRGYLENGTAGSYFGGEPSSSEYGSYYSSSTGSSYENVLRDISVIINQRNSEFTFPTQVDMLAIVANHSEPLLQEVMQQLKYYGKPRPHEKVTLERCFWNTVSAITLLTDDANKHESDDKYI